MVIHIFTVKLYAEQMTCLYFVIEISKKK